jgi:hypothetical protein
MSEYKVNSINIKLYDRGETCAAEITFDPPLKEEDSLDNNDQPCLLIAFAILEALQAGTKTSYETLDEALTPFKGMRSLK